MFSLFNKQKNDSSSALVAGQNGLSIVTLGLKGEYPSLEVCDFTPWENKGDTKAILAKKVKQFGLAKKPCNTVLELGDYSILSVDMPDVPPDELRAAVRWQIKDLIDYHVDDAIVDIFDMPPSGATNKQSSTYVVVARRSIVQNLITRMQDAKVNLSVADIPELVLRNISQRLIENEVGVVMVYLTRESGLLVITRQSTLYFARPLPIGYEQLNRGITDTETGNNPQFDQLVLEVQRSLDYYDRYFQQPTVSGLVLTPTEVPIAGLDIYLHQMLGLKVRMLNLGEFVDCEPDMSVEEQAHCVMAVGAAMRKESASL
ncbi:MAG TPA: hypothetical protein ENK06_14725 [Gammaproteobacteria bacterium]|nr:hypothetical protein [Gammaproteobacteria bacterium]